MNQLVSTLAFWLLNKKHKIWHFVAVILVLTSITFSLYMMSQGPGKGPKDIPSRFSYPHDIIQKGSHETLIRPQGKPTSPSPTPNPTPYDSESERAIRNGERTENFGLFRDKLTEFLKDDYDETFSRNLAHSILEMLHEGKGDEDDTLAVIRKELGDGASDEEVRKVHMQMRAVLRWISENHPPTGQYREQQNTPNGE